MFTGDSVPRLTATFHHLLSEEAVALDPILVPLAARYGVLPEANHLHFRVQSFSVLYSAAEVCRFEVEHSLVSCFWGCRLFPTDKRSLHDYVNPRKNYFTPLCK
jgi:hypothetical protein